MNFVCILLLIGWSTAARCDKYVTGQVWIHKMGTDETATPGYNITGCKKGCFDNNTYKDDGSKKCEKCSIIEEESLCLKNIDTCLWKGGKCKSQSCPDMAKHQDKNESAYKQCIEGTPQEQAFSSLYMNLYTAHADPAQDVGISDYDIFWDTSKRFCSDMDSVLTDRVGSYYDGGVGYNVPRNALEVIHYNLTYNWVTFQSGYCRLIPSEQKRKCEFDVTTKKIHSFNTLTFYDDCMATSFTPPFTANLTYNNLNYGFSTVDLYCAHLRDEDLKTCETDYNRYISGCHGNTDSNGIARPVSVSRITKNNNHISTEGARTKCHLVYGCMYSKDNERCSVWAVWAFVLVLVLCIVVVVVILMVVCFLLLSKLIGAKSKTAPVESESESANKPTGGNEGATTEKSIAPTDSQSTTATVGATAGGGAGAEAASSSSSSSSSSPDTGLYVLIKLGKQEKQTKKKANLDWGETVVFTDVGGEDDDAEITLHEDNGSTVGTGSLRITSYVGKKENASVPMSDGGAEKGMLELEVEVVVKEDQQPPSIIATFVVHKGLKK